MIKLPAVGLTFGRPLPLKELSLGDGGGEVLRINSRRDAVAERFKYKSEFHLTDFPPWPVAGEKPIDVEQRRFMIFYKGPFF